MLFDFDNEVFGKLEGPQEVERVSEFCHFKLMEFGGSLCASSVKRQVFVPLELTFPYHNIACVVFYIIIFFLLEQVNFFGVGIFCYSS